MKRSHKFSLVFILLLGFSISLFAHCQIPCGIYGDQTRFTLMHEHVTTTEKSMKQWPCSCPIKIQKWLRTWGVLSTYTALQ